MPKNIVTINGIMIDLGSVRLFNKKDKISKQQPRMAKNLNCKDYGIEFIFYSGSRKTIWWYNDNKSYSTICSDSFKYERDLYYKKLTEDFGIEQY
jgi:hypothetical protein